MPSIPFHLYHVLLISIMVGSQFAVYGVVSRLLLGEGKAVKIRKLVLVLALAILNLPFPFVLYTPWIFLHGFMRTFIMWPFYAYQTLSVAVLLAVLISLPTEFIIRISKHLKNTLNASATLTRTRTDEDERIMAVPPSKSRRAFIKTTSLGIGAYTFAGSLHSIYTREEYKIENIKLPLSNLPPQIDGLRIAMISDVHVGMYMVEEDMAKYNDAINKLEPDMIFIPGDFITSKTEEIFPFVKSFSSLKSKYGIYTCLGNHDFFGNPETITEQVRGMGMKVLRNETEELEIDGARLMLSGVDDGSHANFKKVSFEATSLNTTRILLCHKPYYFEAAVAGKFDVMLSGHTHGGQIVLVDFLGVKVTPAALVSHYISGKYRRGNSLLYVSRGIGTVGLPVRVNCPPEITVFTLTKKS